MSEVTQILSRIESGDPAAAAELLPRVYDELRRLAACKLANEQPGLTLQATALVHEAYVRLVGPMPQKQWDHRGHFFAAAAEAMRRILVERSRHKQTEKRGGHVVRLQMDPDHLSGSDGQSQSELLAVHEVLDQLHAKSPRKAELIKLRYFLGCTMEESAEILGIALATAEDDWTYAKAWLRRQWLRGEQKKSGD